MKLTNKYIGSFLASVLLLTSCSDDFLQKNSLTAVSASTFWQNESDALRGLAACYDGLQSTYLYNGGPWNCGPLNMDALTDNGGHFNWSGWMAGYDICNGTHSASSWLVGSYWSACYEVVKRCNVLIKNIDNVPMSESLISQYKAEAVALRALMYINLTMTYNDVPYLTEPLSITEANYPKSDRATIVENVIAELQEVTDALPTTADRGRITKGAALSILGRIALYNEKWDVAVSAYKEVVNSNTYSLFNDYSALFTQANEGCNEIVLAARFEGPGLDEGQSLGAHYGTPLEAINGTMDLSDAYYCTDGKPISTSPLYQGGKKTHSMYDPDVDRYLNRDLRLKATLFVPGMSWNGNTDTYGGASPSYSTVYVMKYYDPTDAANCWDSGQDFYIIRYSEVLLSYAEALVEKGGYNISEVIALIDEVRSRAGMPKVENVEGTGLTQDGLRQLIRHERRVELAFEGLRMFDVYRWKLLKDAVDRINAENTKYGFWYETRYYRGEMEYIWPIPQSEVDSNTQLEQHDLWK